MRASDWLSKGWRFEPQLRIFSSKTQQQLDAPKVEFEFVSEIYYKKLSIFASLARLHQVKQQLAAPKVEFEEFLIALWREKMANIDKVKAQNYLNIHLSAGFYASGLESLACFER